MKSLFTESAGSLPSRAGRSRAGLQLPLIQADTGEHKQPRPLWQTLLWPRHGGEHGSSSTTTAEELDSSLTPRTEWAHQTDTLQEHRDVGTGRAWGHSHLTTASQVTPATVHRAFPLSHHAPVFAYIQSTKKYTAVIKLSSLKCWHVANTFK